MYSSKKFSVVPLKGIKRSPLNDLLLPRLALSVMYEFWLLQDPIVFLVYELLPTLLEKLLFLLLGQEFLFIAF